MGYNGEYNQDEIGTKRKRRIRSGANYNLCGARGYEYGTGRGRFAGDSWETIGWGWDSRDLVDGGY